MWRKGELFGIEDVRAVSSKEPPAPLGAKANDAGAPPKVNPKVNPIPSKKAADRELPTCSELGVERPAPLGGAPSMEEANGAEDGENSKPCKDGFGSDWPSVCSRDLTAELSELGSPVIPKIPQLKLSLAGHKNDHLFNPKLPPAAVLEGVFGRKAILPPPNSALRNRGGGAGGTTTPSSFQTAAGGAVVAKQSSFDLKLLPLGSSSSNLPLEGPAAGGVQPHRSCPHRICHIASKTQNLCGGGGAAASSSSSSAAASISSGTPPGMPPDEEPDDPCPTPRGEPSRAFRDFKASAARNPFLNPLYTNSEDGGGTTPTPTAAGGTAAGDSAGAGGPTLLQSGSGTSFGGFGGAEASGQEDQNPGAGMRSRESSRNRPRGVSDEAGLLVEEEKFNCDFVGKDHRLVIQWSPSRKKSSDAK